jgi:hypothetical protein
LPVPKFPAQAKFGTLERLNRDKSAAKVKNDAVRSRFGTRVATAAQRRCNTGAEQPNRSASDSIPRRKTQPLMISDRLRLRRFQFCFLKAALERTFEFIDRLELLDPAK